MVSTAPQTGINPNPRPRPTLADRHKLRVAYIHGEGPLTRLSAKLGISYGTARQWHDAENWPKLRADYDAKRMQSVLAEVQPPQPERAQPAQTPQPADGILGKIQVLEAQLAHVDELLKTADTDRAWDTLTKAKDRLLENWYVLTNHPKPGRRKPAPERPRYQAITRPEPTPTAKLASEAPEAPPPTPLAVVQGSARVPMEVALRHRPVPNRLEGPA